jgi:signal transduction histidine kinase
MAAPTAPNLLHWPPGWRLAILLLMFICVQARAQKTTPSWQEIQRTKRGTMVVHWFESKPFIYRNSREQMEGVEYDLMVGFQQYLRDRYQIELELEWHEADDFSNTYQTVRKSAEPCFGASAFSITPEREQEVGFTPHYMADISVLISSQGVPVTESIEDFKRLFSGMRAVTIQGTTYEHDLKQLQLNLGMDFDIEYIPSYENILRAIESRQRAFGFIDLPVYMMIFSSDPSVKVIRQNYYPVKRRGYALIYPKGSDWAEPVSAYFLEARADFEKVVSKYLDVELYRFVEELATQSNDELQLLNKEKQIQYEELLAKAVQLEQKTRTSNYLIALTTVVGSFLFIIVLMYHKRNVQKKEIEAQRASIEQKRLQLEKRNEHLVALNEEKNNLIKMLAHDLRTPINHVQGLAQVFMLSNPQLPDDQKVVIQNITDAALRLNKMIANILDIDAVENHRVKVIAEMVPLVPLLQKVIKSFEKNASRKEITLVLVAAEARPIIVADPLFLIQIFENLISNALKFSEKRTEVTVHVQSIADHAMVSVKDQGPGLSEEDQQLLFKKFQRLSTHPTDGEKSTGLGLSIVKQYVELMGGRVWCESEPGKGASFNVTFPLA